MARVASATPQRRVTRSQSRELDDPTYGKQSSCKASQGNSGQGRTQAKHLPTVIEESSPSSRPAPTSPLSSSRVPDTPANDEGNTNISGTTFLPQDLSDSDSEDGEPDLIDMAEEMPDLQQASTRLLELVGTNSSDAKGILEVAKRIANPANTENKRFKRAYKKLADSMKVFTHHTYIDAASVGRSIPSVTTEDASASWDPSPYLYRANCARLALSVLSAAVGSQTPAQAIEGLDRQFPIPFMDRMLAPKAPLTGGASSAMKATVDLALEIRTQSVIAELEKRQGEKDFNARSILKSVFYHDLALDNANDSALDPGSLRGFNLEGTFEDDNGFLPDTMQDDVIVRIDELETYLFDDNDDLNIKGLRTVFSWPRFCLRTARFVRAREQEFKSIMAAQPAIEDVHALVVKEIEKRSHPNAAQPPDQSQFGPDQEEPSATLNDEHEIGKPGYGEEASEEPASEKSAPKQYSLTFDSSLWRTAEAMDFLANSLMAKHSRDFASPGTQPANTHKGKGVATFPSARGANTPAKRTEITETPEPELSQSQRASRNGTQQATEHDGPVLNPIDEELIFGLPSEAVMSTSPQGSERIKRVSHYPGRFFDSPSAAQTQPSRRRTIFDRQPNASRVSPLGSEEPRSAERPRAPAIQLQSTLQSISRKRGRGDSDDETSDDDSSFDQDNRNHSIAQRRAQVPEQTRPTDKRQRVNDDESGPENQLQESLAASQTQSGSQMVERVPPVSTQRESRWLEENSTPRSSTRPKRVIAPSSRTRRRWTQEEDDRLLMLVGVHATQWAVIERQDQICPASNGGPKLGGRTQVDMKDRARTLKRKYVRYHRPYSQLS
ncbi:uncharacterized protein N7482_009697 [Penicillium canariense]|uniref:Myb-like domain-containing protein n=1 Tax=Penicillium canariense TaxID=189055 RepID=A0A9W9LFY2_9EURO|nr:uncharacterized protein N7482_009697 [Penicillium canariense]KAJ5153219.1 hypothetical protein N7482_009697 [Penicillium canariense]